MTPERIADHIRESSHVIALLATTYGATEANVERSAQEAMVGLINLLEWVDKSQFEAIREAVGCNGATGAESNFTRQPCRTGASDTTCMNCAPVPKLESTLPQSESVGNRSTGRPRSGGDIQESGSRPGNCSSSSPSPVAHGSSTGTTGSGERGEGQQT